MIPRPASCNGCPLNTTSVPGFCPDKIPKSAQFLFLAEAPGSNEITQAEPMVGKAGFVLKSWLIRAVPSMQLAWERGEIGLANVLRCLPPETKGRPYPSGDIQRQAEQHCRQYDAWPDTVHTVVLFGEHSQRLVFHQELDAEDATDRGLGHTVKGVMGRIGREIMHTDGRRYVFAPHPAFILRSPALVEHGQRALQIAVNTEQLVDVSYVPWEHALEVLCQESIVPNPSRLDTPPGRNEHTVPSATSG